MTENPLAALDAATAHFTQVLAAVRDDDWARPTPCTDWTVTDLVDHVVGGNRWAVLLLGGAEGRAAIEQVRAGTFGPDRVGDYRDSVTAQRAAFAEPSALMQEVEHVLGRMPGGRFLGMRVGDNLLHSWDLARAIGADDRLPADLVAQALTNLEPMAGRLHLGGMFAPMADADRPATEPQARLLQLTGRQIR
jgi:uncharacterized protein (TIGR03086 family)